MQGKHIAGRADGPRLQATLTVFGANGLLVNGVDFGKGDQVGLVDGDELVICERLFRWESAREVTLQLDVSLTCDCSLTVTKLICCLNVHPVARRGPPPSPALQPHQRSLVLLHSRQAQTAALPRSPNTFPLPLRHPPLAPPRRPRPPHRHPLARAPAPRAGRGGRGGGGPDDLGRALGLA